MSTQICWTPTVRVQLRLPKRDDSVTVRFHKPHLGQLVAGPDPRNTASEARQPLCKATRSKHSSFRAVKCADFPAAAADTRP